MTHKALLFVNGETPKQFPQDLQQYQIIACTDGAYHHYLQDSDIQPHYLVGDLDSIQDKPIAPQITVIHTPDQNKTDFEKTLLFLMEKGIKTIDVYGASGRASDHFLGNLSIALQYQSQIKLTFYDNYCYFFLAEKTTILHNVSGRIISLIPFSQVNHLTITGFEYSLTNINLALGKLTSLRNRAIQNEVTITFQSGHLFIFVSLSD